MDWDKVIDETIAKDPEMKKLFEDDPSKRELYKQKLIDSEGAGGGGLDRNPKYCMTCMFSHGPAPFADSPMKGHCLIYPEELNLSKPHDVYFNGGICQYYAKETE
jgi:hypothetical protein